MCGLLKPDSGNVIVNGVDVQANPVLAREQMGLVFQSAALFDYMTVWENVLFGLRRKSKQSHAVQDQKAKDALELVGLLDSLDLMPGELSGGMRKRLGLARALVLEPRVMLYDEPTTGLDPITTYTIDSLIVDVRKRLDMTSIVVSHDLSSVFRIADRIAFLDAGELVFVGTPASFKESKHPAILELLEKAFASALG
jgi:phospholipid/cholesterol/gamma-HCH transport system ATP-binding protein